MMLPPAEGGMRYASPRGGRRAGSGGHATRTRGHASEMGGFSPPIERLVYIYIYIYIRRFVSSPLSR